MAVYGNMLNFFPEQFRSFNYYSMKPQPVASYSTRKNLGKVRGIFQYMKKGELSRQNDVLADVNIPTFWTKKTLNVGNFIEKDDELYRIVNPADWLFEGGFHCYVLETFVGNSDVQIPDTEVNLGQSDYD